MKNKAILVALAASAAMLAGCSSPRQPGIDYGTNYGHPALNSAFNAPAPQQPSMGGTIVGATLGGIIGSRFGSGSGRVAAAGAGAAVGAMAMGQGGISSEGATGALLGGLVGSRFGSGSGQLAATAIGAGLGAYLMAPPAPGPTR